jgi:hypothetical protein
MTEPLTPPQSTAPLPPLRLPVAAASATANGSTNGITSHPLPAGLLLGSQRGDGSAAESLVPGLQVTQRWQLAQVQRGEAGVDEVLKPNTRLLALETLDGSTVYMRADALAAQLQRARPELLGDDGAIDFSRFRAPDAVNRSGAGDWVWRQISQLVLPDDDITRAAAKLVADEVGAQLMDEAAASLSRAGAARLMALIESRLAGPPGLYRWRGGALAAADRCSGPDDPALAELARGGPPALVFIHGTGSHTLGGFGDLPGSASWPVLQRQYGERIFGLEHRTFSESPIDNAMALVETLPAGATLHLVSHSRGGLVGDLLCLSADDAADGASFDALVEAWRRPPRPDELDAEARNPALRQQREDALAHEQAMLRALAQRLREKQLKVTRFVRVAAPARGTALLSDNLDVFLSGLLSLVRSFGAWSVGAVAGALATPVAAQAAKAAADQGLKFLARVVLEIADKRLQPQVVPGIEAMLPEAPLGTLLGRAAMRPELQLALITGDIEGGGWGQRLGVLFTDWMFFDKAPNDLVVNTASMFGGLATPRAAAARTRALFVQGANVNHFRYFRDDTRAAGVPLPQALQQWLAADDALASTPAPWLPLADAQAALPAGTARGAPADAPLLVLVPGIMGSVLRARGETVWVNPLALAIGKLDRIAIQAPPPIDVDGLLKLAYGKLTAYLSASHQVDPWAYDWRLPLLDQGHALADHLRQQLKRANTAPKRPLNLLAHSMGGLVVRAAFAVDTTLWDDIVATGGRLLMLGTPNHGAHGAVENLLGRSGTVRMLARADLHHSMQQVLDLIAGFDGALHLLPAPGFIDATGQPGLDYHDPQTWATLKPLNNDFWFGRQLAGVPAAAALQHARDFWATVADTRWVARAPQQVAYIYGQGDLTTSGLLFQTDGQQRRTGLAMLCTHSGDGTVTWSSSELRGLPEDRRWLMPVDHMALVATTDYFDDLQSLLLQGVPRRLGRLPASRGADALATPLLLRQPAPPPGYPAEDDLTRALLGGGAAPLPVPTQPRQTLVVQAKAMDVRFAQVPVLCGHYIGDPIAGAEALIDRHLVAGALSRRAQLGIHAGATGTASVVLMPRSAVERRQGLGCGALAIGLGEMGPLSGEQLAEAVRGGVLRYLMHASDRLAEERGRDAIGTAAPPGDDTRNSLKLASLLLGTNSAAQLSVEDSVKAVVLGVLRANRDFADGRAAATAAAVQVAELTLVEVYRDAAISAAHSVRQLAVLLDDELRDLQARVSPATTLAAGDGVRDRLRMQPGGDYWPRLELVDADHDDSGCDADCFAVRVQHNIPPDALRQLLQLYGATPPAGASTPATGLTLPPQSRVAERLRCVYMGERALSPEVLQQRQPGLVEQLVAQAVSGPDSTRWSPDSGFGHMLFQLMLPLAFKGAVRNAPNLMLVLDEATANLPWEMMAADGKPLVLTTRLVRQLKSRRFRPNSGGSERLSACVIANPSTAGYHAQFGGSPPAGQPDRLPALAGAEQEGTLVAGLLTQAGFTVRSAPPDANAVTVFQTLFAQAPRVLVIAAHGIHAQQAADGSWRSGVVLSDGQLLSAAEVGLLEQVPDLVFLDCCQLGKIGSGAGASQKLAYSLARALIEMGVRCVVAAGWAVDDAAALTFSQTFFDALAVQGRPFADAVSAARHACYERHRHCNTWGAYQAYGDPLYRLRPDHSAPPADATSPMCAPEELLQWLDAQHLLLVQAGQRGTDDPLAQQAALTARLQQRLASLPGDWAERGDVLHAIGRLHAELGPLCFDAASAALLRALNAPAAAGHTTLAAIELLANCEVRSATALLAAADAQAGADALASANARASQAVARLELLLRLVGPTPSDAAEAAWSAATGHAQAERLALLGSALKLQAELRLAGPNPGWGDVAPLLHRARDAYAAGTRPDAPAYQLLNRLQLDAVLGTAPDSAAAQVAEVRQAAQTRFASSLSFWDAVTEADSELTLWLCEGSPASDDETLAALAATYALAIGRVPSSARQRDSVSKQLRVLQRLLALKRADDPRAALLAALHHQVAAM